MAAVAAIKGKCRALLAAGMRDFKHAILMNGVLVTARCIPIALRGSEKDFLVKLLVEGGSDGAILYSWLSNNVGEAIGPCKFGISDADPSGLPPSQRVTAAALAPLGNGLSFTTKVFASPSFVAAPLLSLRRIRSLLERMVRLNSLFAQQMLGWLIARTTITRKGEVLRTVLGDCILSRWNGSDFYLLLGSFPREGEEPSTVAGAPLADQPYQGVIVAWSVLKAALTGYTDGSHDSTFFQANLDSSARYGDPVLGPTIASLVTDVTDEYTRKDPYVTSSIGSLTDSCRHTPTTSPYASVYERHTNAGGSNFSSTGTYEAHTLDSSGHLSINDLTDGFLTATATGSFAGGSSPSSTISPVECDLTFFTGDAFVKYGTNQSSGSSGGADLIFTERVNAKPTSGARSGSDVVDFGLYVPEYKLVVSDLGDGMLDTSILDSEALHLVTLPAHLPATDPTPFGGVGPPYLAVSREVIGTGPGAVINESETVLGLGPFVDLVGSATATLYPQAAGVPFLVPYDTTFDPPVVSGHGGTLGGIYWPRDGGMGIFIFQFPTDPAIAAARAADVAKYQSIYFGMVGYRRIVNADGSVTLESGYEDPEVVIARIAAATTVIVNNFASPALYPWLPSFDFSGVILDP